MSVYPKTPNPSAAKTEKHRGLSLMAGRAGDNHRMAM